MNKFYRWYSQLPLSNLIIVTLLISFLSVTGNQIGESDGLNLSRQGFIIAKYTIFASLNILPLLLIVQKKTLTFLKSNQLNLIYLILYYLLFVPIFLAVQTKGGSESIDLKSSLYLIINTINIGSLVVAHILLIKYAFLDMILQRRKPRPKDSLVILLTYLTIGISFGFLYTLVSNLSEGAFFHGVPDKLFEEHYIRSYLLHIYYSFITITSVGFGDIYPLTWSGKLLTILEALLGLFLLTFSLGIILGATNDDNKKRQEEDELIRDYLLKKAKELADDDDKENLEHKNNQ